MIDIYLYGVYFTFIATIIISFFAQFEPNPPSLDVTLSAVFGMSILSWFGTIIFIFKYISLKLEIRAYEKHLKKDIYRAHKAHEDKVI